MRKGANGPNAMHIDMPDVPVPVYVQIMFCLLVSPYPLTVKIEGLEVQKSSSLPKGFPACFRLVVFQ